MRTVVLSDSAVIEELNKNFITLELNLSRQGFPAALRGLSPWQKAFERDRRFSVGLSTSIVLDPSGNEPYGTSGCGHLGEIDSSINYDPVRFLEYLRVSHQQYLSARKALEEGDRATLREIRSEIVAQLHEANRCSCPSRKEIFPSDAGSEGP